MKAIFFALPLFCLPAFANPEFRPWGEGPAPAPESAFAALEAAAMPAEPATMHTPEGAVVLHGDLLKDGRHRALIGTDQVTLATLESGKWTISQKLGIAPAWVAEGKKPWEAGYYRIIPPALPFTLENLDGDGKPDLVIAFDNDGESIGYRLAMNRGSSFELLDLSSDRQPPEFRSDFLRASTSHSPRKALWGIDHYYRWKDGKPEPAYALAEDARDPGKPRWILARYDHGKLDGNAYEVIAPHDGDGSWNIRSGKWDEEISLTSPENFARVHFQAKPGEEDATGEHFHQFNFIFRRLSGMQEASVFITHPIDLQQFRDSKASATPIVEGIPEALKLLGPGEE